MKNELMNLMNLFLLLSDYFCFCSQNWALFNAKTGEYPYMPDFIFTKFINSLSGNFAVTAFTDLLPIMTQKHELMNTWRPTRRLLANFARQ